MSDSSRKKIRHEENYAAPPTAAEVLKNMEKQRRIDARASSSSPQPPSRHSSPKLPDAAVKSEKASSSTLIHESHLISFMNQQSGSVTVKHVITAMKGYFVQDPRNKERLRTFMKKLFTHDKQTGIVTLKDD